MEIVSDFMRLLVQCEAACERCINGCLSDGNALGCCRLCRDCADICRLCFTLQARQSHYVPDMSRICAEICDECADECHRRAVMHEHCRICEQACRECAEACRDIYLSVNTEKA